GFATGTVYLNRAAATNVTVTVSTEDGTALSNVNYTPSTISVTIPAGALSAIFQIPIRNDGLRTGDLDFNLRIRGVAGADIAKDRAAVFLLDSSPILGATQFLVRMTPQ